MSPTRHFSVSYYAVGAGLSIYAGILGVVSDWFSLGNAGVWVALGLFMLLLAPVFVLPK
jgi:hypothetical protein